ncbi:MAG TPA: protein kinase [Vicinamibacterales bacterium]|nr:protein kinase [Vicinamibacterales bacterium]
MALASGVRLGAYEILNLIGAGGMGEVYRARDTRLDRTVAIKILPAQFAADPERCERFERECRAVAALNHPHICDLYDVGEAGPSTTSATVVRFLVMEHLEGQTLADRLVRGPLPAAEMLRYAVDLADALDHAHRRGLVHRDLKPGNIMITRAGAKLLDFGLSKLQPEANLIALSTMSPGDAPLTAVGEVLGTYPYIAPEQLMGREADARSDLFALGAIVHEMATGRRAFEGSTAATVVGAVLHLDPPPVSSIQPLAPPALDRIVLRCLAKDPDDRWQTARDLMLELKWIAAGKASDSDASGSFHMHRLAWVAASLTFALLIVGAAAGLSYRWRLPSQEPVERLSLLPPLNVKPAGLSSGGGPAISPDGRRLAFVAAAADGKRVLWVRALDRLGAEPLSTTEGAAYPFWSPDSQSIGFFAEGKLKTVAAAGSPSQTIADALQPRGGSWGKDDVIVFSANAGERWYRVAASGGAAAPMTIEAPNTESYWPFFLPDGRHFLFFGRPEKPGIYVASLDSTASTLVLAEHVGVAYAQPGYLLTLAGLARNSEDRTLVALPFDADHLRITGPESIVAEHVAYETLFARGAFASSQNGRIAYQTEYVPPTQLLWFDREGRQLGGLGGSNGYRKPSLSPDEKTVAVERLDPTTEGTDIWLLDTTRGVASRLTVHPAPDWSPVWSPDGRRVVFTSPRDALPPNLYQQDARAAGPGEFLLSGHRVVHPRDWSSDGRFLVYDALDPKTQWDLLILSMAPAATGTSRTSVPFLQTEFNEHTGQFSPDGRLLAYVSDESGTLEVYVAPFPATGDRWRKRISSSGGVQPRWRHDGKELFYIAPDGTLMAVAVATAPTFDAGSPSALFKSRLAGLDSLITNPIGANYAVSANGQRFLMTSITEQTPPASVTLLLHWPAALNTR